MDFNKEVIEESYARPVIVDFSAAWCGPCKIMKPILMRANQMDDSWSLKIVDIDNNISLAQTYGVRSVPTIIGFAQGEPVIGSRGMVSPQQLTEIIDKCKIHYSKEQSPNRSSNKT